MAWYRWQGRDLVLCVRAQPRARRDAFVGPMGDEMKIALKAPPVDGKANACLLRFLASELGVRRGDVTLISGDHSRSKRVLVRAPTRLPAGVDGESPNGLSQGSAGRL